MRNPSRRRRTLLSAGGVAGLASILGLPLFVASPALAQALKITMGIGLTNDGAPLVFAMQRDKLLEKAAEELGLRLDPEYLNFPVLLRMLQGLAAGQLDIGMLGSTPTIRNLALPNPAVPFAPEAYYPHRIEWVARQEFLQKNPKAVSALMIANARATSIVTKMTPDAVIDMSSQDWASDRPAQRPYVENILYRRRGWSWITEGDARTLVGLSKVKSIYQQELTADLVKRTLGMAAPLARDAGQ